MTSPANCPVWRVLPSLTVSLSKPFGQWSYFATVIQVEQWFPGPKPPASGQVYGLQRNSWAVPRTAPGTGNWFLCSRIRTGVCKSPKAHGCCLAARAQWWWGRGVWESQGPEAKVERHNGSDKLKEQGWGKGPKPEHPQSFKMESRNGQMVQKSHKGGI